MKRTLLFLVLLLAVSCQQNPGPSPNPVSTNAPAATAGETCPSFALTGPDGSSVEFTPDKIINEEVHLLVFWSFRWDPNVATFMERNGELHERYSPRGLNIIGINYDKDPDGMREYLQSNKSPFPVAVGTTKTFEEFQVEALPTSILVDKDGKIRERWEGYFATEDLSEVIKPYLPGRTGSSGN